LAWAAVNDAVLQVRHARERDAALLVPELVAGRGLRKLKLAVMHQGSRRLDGARGKETTARRPASGEMPACGGKLQVAVSAAARWVPRTGRERERES